MSDTALHSSHLKPMTEAQRLYLQQVLATLPSPKKQSLKAALNTAVFWVFISAGLCILWFISSLVVSAVFEVDIGISSSYSTFLFSAILVIAGLFSVNSTRKWLQASGSLYSRINIDLTINRVKEENYNIMNVKCFREPEHNGLIYFLQLVPLPTNQSKMSRQEEAKIRVIYDYESQSNSVEASQLLIIKSVLTIVSGNHCGIVLENDFSGAVLAEIEHFDLTILPEKWPSPDSWLSDDWQNLAPRYAPTTLK